MRKLILTLFISLIAFTASADQDGFQLPEGHYRPISGRTGFIRKVQVGIINGEHQVIGQLCYGQGEPVCNPFNLYINQPTQNPYWMAGDGVMKATFYNPSYGTFTCRVEISAEVFGWNPEGRAKRMLLKVKAPSTYWTSVNGAYCPTPGAYDWSTAVFELVR